MKNFFLYITNLPFLFLIIYVISLFFYKNTEKFKRIILFNTVFFFLFSLPIFFYLIQIPLTTNNNFFKLNENIDYSIILVPTGGIKYYKNSNKFLPTHQSIKRFLDAKKISKELNIPILISGGTTKKGLRAEADVVFNFFKKSDTSNIFLETNSKNSYETAVNVKNILIKKNLSKNIILVTDSLHIKRMSSALRKQGVNPYIKNNDFKIKKQFRNFVPNPNNFSKINKVKYEYMGILFYLITNKVDVKNL